MKKYILKINFFDKNNEEILFELKKISVNYRLREISCFLEENDLHDNFKNKISSVKKISILYSSNETKIFDGLNLKQHFFTIDFGIDYGNVTNRLIHETLFLYENEDQI